MDGSGYSLPLPPTSGAWRPQRPPWPD